MNQNLGRPGSPRNDRTSLSFPLAQQGDSSDFLYQTMPMQQQQQQQQQRAARVGDESKTNGPAQSLPSVNSYKQESSFFRNSDSTMSLLSLPEAIEPLDLSESSFHDVLKDNLIPENHHVNANALLVATAPCYEDPLFQVAEGKASLEQLRYSLPTGAELTECWEQDALECVLQ